MTWLQKLVDFCYENYELIKNNPYIFVSFGIICIGISFIINKAYNTNQKNKYERAYEEIEELNSEIEVLKEENNALKEICKKFDIYPRLIMGTENTYPCPSADALENEIKNKK